MAGESDRSRAVALKGCQFEGTETVVFTLVLNTNYDILNTGRTAVAEILETKFD